jgi:hypothetical protein
MRFTVALALAGLGLFACSGDRGGDSGGRGVRTPTVGSPPATAGAGAAGTGSQGFGNSERPAATGGSPGRAGSFAPAAGEGGECGAISHTAENMLQPADIIFGIDTSGSMSEEVAEVQQNMNRFSQLIIDSGIDVRVIVISTLQGTAMPGGVTVDGPCIAPPLGSGQCPSDSNPPAYVHLDQMVASWDVLDVYINAYPSYREHLRENSLKTFVTISDDNADSATSPFGIIGPQPVLHTAEGFIAAVEGLEPNSPMWSDWRYSGIYSFTACPSAMFGAVGAVHQDLVMRTGGVAGDLCLQEFDPVFDALAQGVTAAVTLACDWAIPASPPGGAFDPAKTNVQLTLDGAAERSLKVPDVTMCGSLEGWHYDDEAAPTKVVVCPATCTRIQAAAKAQVDLLFGCKTETVPVE